MCRILFKRNGSDTDFNKNTLQESYMSNPDGTGLIYYDSNKNKTIIKKFLIGVPFDDIYKEIRRAELLKGTKNIAVHFRYATSGGKGYNQIHPVPVKKDMYLLHNGILTEFEFDPEIMSDTQLAGFWLGCLDLDINKVDEGYRKLLEQKFAGNKLLVIEKNNYIIINEKLGVWNNGIWQSWVGNNRYGWNNSCEDLYEDLETQNEEPNWLSHDDSHLLDTSEYGYKQQKLKI